MTPEEVAYWKRYEEHKRLRERKLDEALGIVVERDGKRTIDLSVIRKSILDDWNKREMQEI